MHQFLVFFFFIVSSNVFGQTLYSKPYGNSKDKAIIFIHGGPSGNSTLFEATTAQKIADEGFYVIIYDRRGEGRSTDSTAKFTYEEYLNDLNLIYSTYKIDKANLIAHSFGGLVATLFAEKYPQKVQSLILSGALISQQETYNYILKATTEISANKKDTITLMRISKTKVLDTTAPYAASFVAANAGAYSITAKATDNSGSATTSVAVIVNATVANDAGISAIVAPVGTTNLATLTPSVSLKNFGSTTLTSATIHYRVDANAFSSFNWTGSLAGGATVNVSLPSVTGYTAGSHTFTAQTTTVNGGTDGNAANNAATSNFTYSNCTNDRETTNNASTGAGVLTIGTAANSQIGSATDVDFYKFTTTAAAPKLRVTLSNLPFDYDILLYNAKSTGAIGSIIGRGQNGGTTTETVVYNSATTAKTYYIKVLGYGGVFSTTQCYNLLVQTGATNFARSTQPDRNGNLRLEENTDLSPLSIYPNPADDFLMVKFDADEEADYNITMTDLIGKTVINKMAYFEAGENETRLDTDQLAKGIYLLKVSRGTERPFVKKVFID